MKRNQWIAVLALCGCLALSGCDAAESYDRMIDRMRIPGSEQTQEEPQTPAQTPDAGQQPAGPEQQPVDGKEPANPTQPPATGADSAPDTPAQPPAGQGSPSRLSVYPQDVPAPDCQTVIAEERDEDGEVEAQYLMTQAELDAWRQALQAAGFSDSEPSVNGVWILRVTTLRQSAGSAADYRVIVELDAADQPAAWPREFSAFPPFAGEGTMELEDEDDMLGETLYLTSYQETRAAYAAYLTALQEAGFTDVGYGLYEKAENGFVYELDTDGAWRDEPTLRLAFRVRRS